MAKNNQVKPIVLTLTKVEAEWLYELLADTFDSGASGTWDENMASVIGDKLDQAQFSK